MEQQVIDVAREAVLTIISVSAPLIGIALLVGLTVSIIQATTQIQEQTLSFVPKIVAVMLSVIVFGSWMLTRLVEFTKSIYDRILNII